MRIKINKNFLYFLFIVFSFFIINSAYAYSSEAIGFYNEGIENVKEKKYEKAAQNFEKALFLDPSIKDAYFNLGSVYRELGEMNKAKEILSNLLRKDPFDDEAAYLLAKLYAETKDYTNAFFYLNSITESSDKYDKAQNLTSYINKKLQENESNRKKTSRNWEKNVLKGFYGPAGVTKDSKGNVYVANYKDNSVQKIFADGVKRENLTGEKLKGPVGLAVDSLDNLYVANYVSGNVIKISPDGKIKIILDKIKQPYYLFIHDDILYITEQEKNSVIMLNLWKL
ncbi:MAG TPA: tetratricopeptide repeat protein [Candidatus Gastranaerophilales bacterium]|nr:tetratricopeptide repeat protein [Candidatus Gastranaerophilales bacterium]